jgi:hypothetical protein
MLRLVKIQSRFNIDEVRNVWISKFYNEKFLKFRNLKIHNALNIYPIFLKLWIFTNLNMVFPVVVLVFD